jgi:xanthine dehydrogenase accessory factor
MEFIYNKITEIYNSGRKAALCTIVATKGSTPLKAGAKMLVFEDGGIYGTVGGGKLEQATISNALIVLKNNVPELYKHDLITQHDMCCGGKVEIYIEPIMRNKKLLLFGAGHVGKAIVKHCLDLDFDITVVDCREGIYNDWDFEGCQQLTAPFDQILPTLSFDENTFIIIATYDHAFDRDILSFCMQKPHYYLGMIGSKTKVARTKEMFLSEGIATKEAIEKVDMPVGIDINAETADEIAISIIARLIKEKNK